MFDELDDLDATEKAGIGAALNRCRALAAKIANELRNKTPEHFADKLSMADIHASLERAADVLSTVKGSQVRGRQRRRYLKATNFDSLRSHGRDKDLSRAEAARSR
jgi:hypothetical protein